MQSPYVGLQLFLATMLRWLPSFRGKGTLAGLLHRRLLKVLSPSQAVRRVRMRDGSSMKVDLRSAAEWRSYYTGEYEGHLASVLPPLTRKCAVLDVGAHIGFWTIPQGRRLQQRGGVCYAFEPVLANFERPRHDIARNGLDSTVRPYALAAGKKNDDITMMLDTRDGALTGNAARVSHAAYEDGHRERSPVSVKVRRLDDMAAELGLDERPCAFMKVDIAGSEPLFLQGAAGFIQQHRPAT